MDLIVVPSTIKYIIYLCLLMCTVIIALQYVSDSQIFWFIGALVVLSFVTQRGFFKQQLLIGIAGMVLACTVELASCLTQHLPLLSVYVFLIIVTGMVVAQTYMHFFLVLFVMNLLVVMAAILPMSTLASMDRVTAILTATVVVLMLQYIYFWRFARHQVQNELITAVRSLKILSKEIFSCLLQPDYTENIYLYERRLHLQKNKVTDALNRLSNTLAAIANQENKHMAQTLALQLSKLNDVLIDGAQLRWRLNDVTALGLCRVELSAVASAINLAFVNLTQTCAYPVKNPVEVNLLEQKINQLEENYHQVLQVATREPVLFLLYICSLKDVSKEMDSLMVMMRAAWQFKLI